MKALLKMTPGLLLLTACSANDTEWPSETTAEEPLYVSLVARIGKVDESLATRTISASSYFQSNDKLGLFIDNASAASCWTYSNNWTPSSAQYWPDKTSEHTFYAYSPYQEGSTFSAVKVPSLSSQSGIEDDLRVYDFLASTVTTSYNVSNGVVQFTGNAALQHKLSRICLHLKNEHDLANGSIRKVVWTATGLTTPSTYSFEDQKFHLDTNVSSTLTSTPGLLMDSDDQDLYYICNPLDANASLQMELYYTTSDQTERVAQTTLSSPAIEAGKNFICTMAVVGGVLTIQNVEVSDWEQSGSTTVIVEGHDESNQ